MITIKQDSELMTNLIAANPVPAGRRFVAIQDHQLRPACFSLSTDAKLNLVIQDDDAATLVDFGQLAGITGAIQAFDVQQSPSSLDVTVCVAVDDGGDKSSFWLLRNLHPGDLVDSIPANKILKGNGLPSIYHLYMSNFDGESSSSDPPLIFAAFQPTDRITKEEQLGFIDIVTDDSDSPAVKLNRSWSLSTNADRIIDVAFCTCAIGDGLFVLYEVAGARKIQFKIFRGDGEGFVVEPKCPSEVKCIATFLDSDDESVLIMGGGHGLSALNSDQYKTTKEAGETILASSTIKGGGGVIEELHIAQSGDELQVWFTTSSLSLQYYTCNASNLPGGTPTPLLSRGRAGQVSPLLVTRSGGGGVHGSTRTSSILSVDKTGNLSLLQQDPASRIWQSYPFYHASTTNTVEVKGYTLRLQATSSSPSSPSSVDESSLIPNCWLRVYSSGTMRCLVNGLEAELTRDGKWFRTDMSGVLNVIFATSDMSCHKVFVDCFCAGTVSSLDSSSVTGPDGSEGLVQVLGLKTSPPLNPSAKAMAKLGTIKSGDDLLAARTQSGKPLVGLSLSKSDADKAAAAIGMLVEQSARADERDALRFAAHAASFKAAVESAALMGPGSVNIRAAMHQPMQFGIWDDIVDGLSDAWEWVTDRVEDVVDWTIDVVETVIDTVTDVVKTVVEMAITLGNEVYRFILDTAETIARGVSWVLEHIGAAIDEIIDFLGFVFQWGDILETADSMVSLFNAGLDYGQQKLGILEEKAKSWIGDAKTQMKDILDDLRNKNQIELDEVKSESSNISTQSSDDPVTGSVAFNWVGYQLQHGGVATNTVMKRSSSDDDLSTENLLAGLWDDFTKELAIAENFIINIGEDLMSLVVANTWNDVTSVLTKLTGDMIDLIMDTLENATGILVKVIRLGLASIKVMGNFEVECPIFTGLWKLITKGRPLTLFNLCALLISIPTTILVKITTGKKPAALDGRLTATTFGQYIEKGAVDGDSSLAGDILALTAPAMASTLFFTSRLAALGLLWDSVTVGGGGGDMMMISKMQQQQQLPTATLDRLAKASLSFSSPVRPRLAMNRHILATVLASGGGGGGRTPFLENIFDTVSLTFETIGLIFTWPPNHMHADHMEWIDFFRWGVWFCDLTNDAAIVITRAAGALADIPRAVTKWWRAIVTMFTCLPKLLMELTVILNDYVVKNETMRGFVFHVLEASLGLFADAGFIVAAGTDKIKGAEEFFYTALGVFLGCTGVSTGLKVLDYVIESTEGSK